MLDNGGALRGAALRGAFALALLLPTRLAAVPPLEGLRVFLLNPGSLVAAKSAIDRRVPAVMPASRYDDAEFQAAVRRLPAFAATDRATLITR